MHEEATGAAELVGLHRQHLDGQFLVGQVGTGELEALRHLDLVDVHCARLRVGAAGLEFLEAVLAEVDLVATRSVVVGGHRFSLSCIDVSLGVSNAGDAVLVPGSTDFLYSPEQRRATVAEAPPPLRGTALASAVPYRSRARLYATRRPIVPDVTEATSR